MIESGHSELCRAVRLVVGCNLSVQELQMATQYINITHPTLQPNEKRETVTKGDN